MATTKKAARANYVAELYQQAATDIMQTIAAKHEQGRIAHYEQALLADIKSITDKAGGKAKKYFKEAVPKRYLEGMQQNLQALAGQGAVPIDTQAQLTQVHQSAVNVLIDNAVGQLEDAANQVGRRVQDAIRTAGLNAVTTKTTTGQTVRQTAQALRETLAAQGIKAVGGMQLDKYADLVARSTTREATNRGAINQGTELGYDLVQFSSHASPCPVCAQFEGRVYSVSGSTSEYPALYSTAFKGGYANIHANCKHVVNTYVPALADDPEGDKRRSNEPFEDSRTEKQRAAYLEAQRKRAKARAEAAKREQAARAL